MQFKEAAFWVGLTMFGTGLYFIFEPLDHQRLYIAVAFIVVGLFGMAYSVYNHHYPNAASRLMSKWIWLPLLALTLLVFGYDLFYHKHDVTAATSNAQTQDTSQQQSHGNQSPNIKGDKNTVIYNNGDPRTSKKLDEIKELLEKQQGTKNTPAQYLREFPLGYVIFNMDYQSSVFPYDSRKILEDWTFDWNSVQLMDTGDGHVRIASPKIHKKSSDFTMSSIEMILPKKVGSMLTLFSTPMMSFKVEILAIGNDGIVFVIGIDRNFN